MEIEYYLYSDIIKKKTRWYPRGDRKYISVVDIKQILPSFMAKEFTCPPDSKDYLCSHIETKKKDIIEYYEKMLKKKKVDYDKTRFIEATKDEIDHYDFFFIDLRTLNWKKHFDYEISRPTCDFEPCPWGAKITTPVSLKEKYAKNLSIGKCIDVWSLKVRFIISKYIKETFESEGITGLSYKPCLIAGNDVKKPIEDMFYVAEISSHVTQEGREIYLRSYCKKHSITISKRIIGQVTSRNAITSSDFQMIDKVNVRGKEYIYRTPFFFVSRKVLKILLENDIFDLRSRCIYFKDGLTPVPFN